MKIKLFLFLMLLIISLQLHSQDFWTEVYTSGETIFAIDHDSINNTYIATGDGLIKTNDNGVSWMQVQIPSNNCYIVNIDNYDNIYIASNSIYKSTDYGNSWISLAEPVNPPNNLFSSSEGNLFSGFYGGIQRYDNSEETWELVLDVESSEVINSIIENSEGVLFAGSTNFIGDGGIYRSDDGGLTWNLSGLVNSFISSLALGDDDAIYAVARGHYDDGIGGVFRSYDGVNWEVLNSELLVIDICLTSNSDIYIGCSILDGFSGGVYFSNNNGESWQMVESDLITQFTEIEHISVDLHGYVYAVKNYPPYTVYRSTQSVSSPQEEIMFKPDIQLSNYPNPFNPTTEISFSLNTESTENTELKIYNVKGQKIKSMTCHPEPACPESRGLAREREGRQTGTTYSTTWNGTDQSGNPVSSGVYFYKLNVENSPVGKMVLLK